jgi:hypothetical protein
MTVDESKIERILGIVFICLGLVLLFVIIPWQIKDVGADFPTPRSFPNIIAGCLSILGILLFLSGFRKIGKEDLKIYTLSKKEARLVSISLGLLILYVIGLSFLPYIPVTMAVLGLMIWFYGQKNWIKLVSVAVCVPVAIYYAFSYLLRLKMP